MLLLTHVGDIFSASAQTGLRGFGASRIDGEATSPVQWSASARMTSEREGVITFTATIATGWHIYGMELAKDGPQPTRFTFATGKEWKTIGKMTVSTAPVKQYDSTFDAELSFWDGKVSFSQKFRLIDSSITHLNCSVSYMGCNDLTCLPPASKEFVINIQKKAGK